MSSISADLRLSHSGDSALVQCTQFLLEFLSIAVHLRALKVQGFLLSFLKGYFLYF
jgi:hypothetical protein